MSKWSIFFVLLVTSFIVIPNIGRESLWLDEIFSAAATLKSDSLIEVISIEPSPPLYHILLFYWEKLFGSSDIIIRLLSYIFTLLGLVLSYLLLNKYFTRRVANLFSILSAFTPGVLLYSQEARSYALLYALASIASIHFFIFIYRIREKSRIEIKLIIQFFIIGVLLCYTHYFGSLLIFLLSLVAIIYSFNLKRINSTITLVFVSLSIGLVGCIWILFQLFYLNIGDHFQNFSWGRNSIINIVIGFSNLLSLYKLGIVVLLLLLIPFLIKISHFLDAIKRFIIMLIPVFLLFLASYLLGLMVIKIYARYLIVTIPLILLFTSFIFTELYSIRKGYVLVYIIGLLTISVYVNYTYERQDWRGMSKYIVNNFDSTNCKLPIRAKSDGSFSRLMFVSYYLGSGYTYSADGPEIQSNCDLIYVDGHTNEKEIHRTLAEYNISVPYDILSFNKVYVVVKK